MCTFYHRICFKANSICRQHRQQKLSRSDFILGVISFIFIEAVCFLLRIYLNSICFDIALTIASVYAGNASSTCPYLIHIHGYFVNCYFLRRYPFYFYIVQA